MHVNIFTVQLIRLNIYPFLSIRDLSYLSVSCKQLNQALSKDLQFLYTVDTIKQGLILRYYLTTDFQFTEVPEGASSIAEYQACWNSLLLLNQLSFVAFEKAWLHLTRLHLSQLTEDIQSLVSASVWISFVYLRQYQSPSILERMKELVDHTEQLTLIPRAVPMELPLRIDSSESCWRICQLSLADGKLLPAFLEKYPHFLKLTDLKLSNSFTPTIYRLTELRKLHLIGCGLKDFSVDCFTCLDFLDLSYNELTEAPRIRESALPSTIILCGNQLRKFPVDYIRRSDRLSGGPPTRSLAHLNLNENPLQSMDDENDLVPINSTLNVLSLRGCGLTKVPRLIKRFWNHLYQLDLSHNQLQGELQVPLEPSVLDLSYNQLTKITFYLAESSVAMGRSCDRNLYLQGNQLTSFDNFLEKIGYYFIDLSENPLVSIRLRQSRKLKNQVRLNGTELATDLLDLGGKYIVVTEPTRLSYSEALEAFWSYQLQAVVVE